MFAQMLLLAQAVASLAGAQPSRDDIEFYNSEHRSEAKRLAVTDGQVLRSEGTLTVSWRGKAVATLSDVSPYACAHAVQPCVLWSFASILMLRPASDAPMAPDASMEPYPAFIYSSGVGGKLAIVDHDGTLVWTDFMIAAKGRYIASGSFQGIETPAHFHILDWSSPGHATAWSSDRACEPIKWMSEYNLAAVCDIGGQKLAVAGRFRPLYNGNWSFIPSGWMDSIGVSRARTGERYRIIKNKAPLPVGFELKSVRYDTLMSAKPGTAPGEEVLGYRKLD